MKPELGSMDLIGKSGTVINVCWQTNGGYGCSLCIKMVGLTLMGGDPWSLVGPIGARWDGKT